jgi:cold shock CspA family protein
VTGIVKKWLDKGYGWITNNQTGLDYFAHQSAINMKGFRQLIEGQEVIFNAEKTDRGWKAINITIEN